MSDTNVEIATVDMKVTPATLEYFKRLMELGAVEGAPGEQKPCEELVAVLQALHHVLAGGKVSVAIDQQGSPDLVGQLGELQRKALDEANSVNALAGDIVVMSV